MNLSIAVIAKECRPGRVKTRLTPPLTAVQAATLAQASLSQTLRTVRAVDADRRLLVFEGMPRPCDAEGFEVFAQAGGGLDERLAAVCRLTAGPLLILGMDTPQFTPGLLAELVADWRQPRPRFPAWLGPARDGGFWALGLHRPDGALIRGVPMSTAGTGDEQGRRLAAAGLAVGRLPALTDVDTFDDALRVAAACPGSEFGRAVRALSLPARRGTAVPL
ncbi:TIGR04282 family arsenosugar biosynthesis glycosyltransferase [Specibacter cremeus]|uniref:TIGR04282 family arsenosugar biosynthesis glycosyltransferase n=1 Tax=Specibacter cremeus TaxID=1629051 RepID=UPI000F7910C4|nr:DUF2064 domain-containing protein [Specibacter cremeus]